MRGKNERDYIATHKQIRDKLLEMANVSPFGCVAVTKIASELGMDQRTVRAHLKIVEIDNAGVFMDPEEKEFCPKEGFTLLVKRLELMERASTQEGELKGS